MSNIVYINVLADSLQKKQTALQEILKITKQQEELLKIGDFAEEDFLKLVNQKQRYINKIQELDSGFEAIYNRVKVELEAGKEQYRSQITRIQRLIVQVTELGVDIEALEKRNKAQMDKVIEQRQEIIRGKRTNNNGVSNYYRNMLSQQYNQSYFLDQKK